MEQVGMFEAKTHFSEIVERVVTEGRPVTVTRRGPAVVDITPTQGRRAGKMSRSEALKELAKLRREVQPMTRDEFVTLVAEGRGR